MEQTVTLVAKGATHISRYETNDCGIIVVDVQNKVTNVSG